MLRGRRAAIAAVFAVAMVAAVTSGCGSGSGGQALALDPVAAAATKTQNAGAARIRFAMAISGSQLHGKTLRMRGTGAIEGTSAEINFKPASLAGLLGPRLKNGSMKEIVLEQDGDYVIYMRLPFLSSQLPGGKAWVKLDLSKLGKAAGVDVGKLLSGSQLQPADLLSMLKADGANVTKVGPATIDGVATTEYRVKIDAAKALQAKGLASSPLFSGVAKHMKTITEQVWIGKDGLVRRVAFRYDLPQGGAPRVGMTMDLFDYGAHVSITAPPSSLVFDATQFVQQGLAGVTH